MNMILLTPISVRALTTLSFFFPFRMETYTSIGAKGPEKPESESRSVSSGVIVGFKRRVPSSSRVAS